MSDNDIEYAREKFGTALVKMTGPEEFSRRVAAMYELLHDRKVIDDYESDRAADLEE